MRKLLTRYARYRCRHRRLLALLGALLYVLGTIALPSLHVGFHRADHTHKGGGLQLLHGKLGPHQHLNPHSHGLSGHDEAEDQGPVARLEGDLFGARPTRTHGPSGLLRHPLGTPASDPAHGDGSLVHFASAFLPASAAVTLPLVELLGPRSSYLSSTERAPHCLPATPKEARGPPAQVALL